MPTYQEIAARLEKIHDERLQRFIESGVDVKTFRNRPEEIDEFQLMIELSAKLVELEGQLP